ncbi:POU domain, class 6, transcription factor 1 [Nymphon striatum]|nr:POU domain, class 6, transcription factor 1 [Nymphon striatum]
MGDPGRLDTRGRNDFLFIIHQNDLKIELPESPSSTPVPPCVSSTQHFLNLIPAGNSDASSTTSDTESAQCPPSPGADSTIVDGINLEEIKDFAKKFKLRRLGMGLTQTQVGEALSAAEGPAYSQSAICRFEKLDITPKSALRIKPVLERWLSEAEERYNAGSENLSEYLSESTKKRKRRTSFNPQAIDRRIDGNDYPENRVSRVKDLELDMVSEDEEWSSSDDDELS